MRRPVVVLACLLAALAATACGRNSTPSTTTASDERPGLGVEGYEDRGRPRPRLSGLRDQEHDAHRRRRSDRQCGRGGAGRIPCHHAREPPQRRRADRRARLARRVRGIVLASTPVRAAVLLSDGPDLPPASRDALAALQPLGAKAAGGAQVVRVGDVARPPGLRTTDIAGRDPFALARALDASTRRAGREQRSRPRRLRRRPRLRHAGRRLGGQGRRPRAVRQS